MIPSEALEKRSFARLKRFVQFFSETCKLIGLMVDEMENNVQVVDWTESRNFFFNRLKRRLAEESLIQQLQLAGGQDLSHSAALALIKDVFSTSSTSSPQEWADDTQFLAWSRQPTGLDEHLKKLHENHMVKEMVALGSSAEALKALPQGLNALLRSVSNHPISSFLNWLVRVLLLFRSFKVAVFNDCLKTNKHVMFPCV